MRRKLTLDLDSLEVESFAVDPAGAARGTVAGHETYGLAICHMTYNTCAIQQTCGDCGGGGGLSDGCYSNACTQNPLDVFCDESGVYCSAEPNGCVYTIDTTCTRLYLPCGNG